MDKHISVADLLELSVSERIQFAEDIWDSIATMPETVHITEKQKEELNRRLEAYHRNPNLGSPWNEVKERILL